jgi:hypothetical protein
VYGITSQLTPPSDVSSMGVATIDDESALHGFTGPAVTFESASTIDLRNVYMGWESTYPYAMLALGKLNYDLKYTGNVEGYGGLLENASRLVNGDFRATIQQKGPLLALGSNDGTDAAFIGGTYDVMPSPWGPPLPERPLLASAGPNAVLAGVAFHLYEGETVAFRGAACHGLRFRTEAQGNTIALRGASPCSYSVDSPSGLDLYGPVRIHD